MTHPDPYFAVSVFCILFAILQGRYYAKRMQEAEKLIKDSRELINGYRELSKRVMKQNERLLNDHAKIMSEANAIHLN